MELDNSIGIDYGSRGQAGWKGANGETVGTCVITSTMKKEGRKEGRKEARREG